MAATRPICSSTSGRGVETPDKFITITVSLVQPKSRGEIRLRAADPLAAPIIRANYLQETADVDALVRGVKLARWFGEADAYEPLRAEEMLPGAAMKSDADLATFVRRDSDTIYHAAGTCRMGPAGDASGRGRCRRCACVAWRACASPTRRSCRRWSTRPRTPPCVMIGEKAALLVRA